MRPATAPAAFACLGADARTFSPVDQLAGRYGRHFQNALVDGTRYWSDDVVEIVPVDRGHAYARVHLEHANGHQCALSGISTLEGPALIYREPTEEPRGGQCKLRILRNGAALRLDDGGGTCSAYCGARGTPSGVTLPWRSKRRITYLTRLKASREYAEAMAALRNIKDEK